MKKFNSHRWIATASLVFAMTFTVTQHTNCAPPPSGAAAGSEDVDSEVRIVDDWSNTEIAFFKAHREVEEIEDTIILDGICGRKSQGVIRWSIQGREDIFGEGICELGGFRIEVSDIELLDCDETYYLEAETESQKKASIYLSKKCTG